MYMSALSEVFVSGRRRLQWRLYSYSPMESLMSRTYTFYYSQTSRLDPTRPRHPELCMFFVLFFCHCLTDNIYRSTFRGKSMCIQVQKVPDSATILHVSHVMSIFTATQKKQSFSVTELCESSSFSETMRRKLGVIAANGAQGLHIDNVE